MSYFEILVDTTSMINLWQVLFCF